MDEPGWCANTYPALTIITTGVDMTAKKIISQALLKSQLSYDPDTGAFTRLKSGTKAGFDNGQGYVCISIEQAQYRAHRLAVLYMTGEWPVAEVDHINGIRSDNRWENLRQVSGRENTQNQRRPHKCSTSGFLGVTARGTKFLSQIRANGSKIYLGSFGTAEEAHTAYLEAKRRMHPACTL